MFGPSLQRWRRQRDIARALRQFRISREQLEARFEEVARSASKSLALKTASFEWHSEVAFGLSPESGLLTAFVSVSVRLGKADENGSPQPETETETSAFPRNASAVFHYQDGVWGTAGRVLFNLEPDEALARFADQFAPVMLDGKASL